MENENINTADMSQDDGIKPRSLRISKASLEKINEIKGEFGGSQETALAGLINLFEMENAKGLVMDRKAEIEQVQMFADGLIKAYINSVQMYANVEDTVKAKFIQKLESNQEVIAGLQGEKNKLSEELNSLKEVNKEITGTISEQEKEFIRLHKELSTTEHLCEEYKKKNDTLAGLVRENEVCKGKNEELSRNLDLLADKMQTLNSQLTEQEQQHKTAIIEVKDIHSKELNEVKGQLGEAEQQYKLGILELKNEHSEAIRELSNRHNKEIEGTNKEYKELLKELDILRKANYELERKLMQRPDAEEEEVTEGKPKRRTKKTEN